jgi:hypothetical protein
VFALSGVWKPLPKKAVGALNRKWAVGEEIKNVGVVGLGSEAVV